MNREKNEIEDFMKKTADILQPFIQENEFRMIYSEAEIYGFRLIFEGSKYLFTITASFHSSDYPWNLDIYFGEKSPLFSAEIARFTPIDQIFLNGRRFSLSALILKYFQVKELFQYDRENFIPVMIRASEWIKKVYPEIRDF